MGNGSVFGKEAVAEWLPVGLLFLVGCMCVVFAEARSVVEYTLPRASQIVFI